MSGDAGQDRASKLAGRKFRQVDFDHRILEPLVRHFYHLSYLSPEWSKLVITIFFELINSVGPDLGTNYLQKYQ